MRVHLFGGVLAFDYMLAGWLRRRGVDAHYFFNIKHSEGDYPWWEDADFDRNAMPAWCHYYPFRLPYLYQRPLSEAGNAFVRDFDRDADLLLVIGEGAFLGNRFRTPYTVWSCGFEVAAAMPSSIRWRALLGRAFGSVEPVRLQRRLNRGHVRRCLGNAASIISVMEFQIPTFLRSLGLTPIAKHLPMLYDCTRYTRCPDPALNARYANESIVFFLPTRHTYGFHDVSDKGADKAIEAFARLVKEDAALRARLILVEKGEQVDRSRAMIRDLDIGSYVDWVPHLSKELMRHYYSMPNVVVLDQFQNEQTIEPTLHAAMRRLGARGSIFAESMCMGVPLISMVGSEWIQRFASRPLVWDACTVEEIVSAMRGAASIAPSEREARADSNRAWAWKHLHWEPLVDNYIDHFQDLIARRKAA